MSSTTALMQELLIETVLFYNSGNRSVVNNGSFCAYKDAKGDRCAIGRILTDAAIERILLDGRNTGFSGSQVAYYYGPEAFIEKWRPIAESNEGKEFLSDLQILHDFAGNWNAKGISIQADEVVRRIVKRYGLDLHTVLTAIEEKMSK